MGQMEGEKMAIREQCMKIIPKSFSNPHKSTCKDIFLQLSPEDLSAPIFSQLFTRLHKNIQPSEGDEKIKRHYWLDKQLGTGQTTINRQCSENFMVFQLNKLKIEQNLLIWSKDMNVNFQLSPNPELI